MNLSKLNPLNWFSNGPIIRFVPFEGAPHVSELSCIKTAASVKPEWLLKQKNWAPREKFVNCPGMDDMLQTGFLLCAWTDIRIKANKAGVVIKMLNTYGLTPEHMLTKLVEGIAPIDNTINLNVMKITTPWALFTKPGYSAQVLPATYHSPFLKDLYIYPGIVDYDKFSTINFIFTPLHECDVTIPAGTPLLQIIPYRREVITGEMGKATQYELDRHKYSFPTRARATYRKYFHQRKKYTLTERPHT